MKTAKWERWAAAAAIVLALVLSLAIGGSARMTDQRQVVFSRESGFYDEPFELKLRAGGGQIYYTLDGSEPDEDSIPYTGPIYIDDASEHENVYSMRTDVSVGFREEMLRMFDIGYHPPEEKLDKCTVVRAAVILPDGTRGPVYTASYFVGFGDKAGYEGMNVLSVVTDPDNLFDYEKGIYVTGKVFDDYVEQVHGNLDFRWYFWPANYNQRGKEWERPVSLQFFDTEKKLFLSKEAGVRIQGGAGRSQLPKSLNFYARTEYDGTTSFGPSLFGTGYRPQRVTLFGGGNDNETKLEDYIVATFSPHRDFAVMEFRPYMMFLDGEFWGVYWLQEKFDEDFISYYYGVDKDDVIIVKNGKLEEGIEDPETGESELDIYRDLVKSISRADLTDPEQYREACEKIDVKNYMEYYATQIFIARYSDWPSGNFALWRTRTTNGRGCTDGKWRWMLFDVNGFNMTSDLIRRDTLSETMMMDPMFKSFMENPEFRQQFAKTILEIADNDYAPEKLDAFIKDYPSFMKESIGKEAERFWGGRTRRLREFETNVASFRSFFQHRGEYIHSVFDAMAAGEEETP